MARKWFVHCGRYPKEKIHTVFADYVVHHDSGDISFFEGKVPSGELVTGFSARYWDFYMPEPEATDG